MKPFGHGLAHPDRPDCSANKRFKTALLEKLSQVNNPQRIPQIRLIRPEFQHRLLITDDRIGCLCHLIPFRRKLFKDCRQHFLPDTEYIFLGGKTHLKIQLIKLPRGTVGSGVLIPETGRDLKIFIKSRCHQQLFVLLGRLGQRIKFPFVFSGRHNIISCPLRRGSGKDRCLDLQKTKFLHLFPQKTDNL